MEPQIKSMSVLKKEIQKIYKGNLLITSNELEVINLATNTNYSFGSSWGGDDILMEVKRLVATYGLYVTNERDNFSLNVRDYLDNVVFELDGDDLRSFIEDGYIRNASDVYNLNKYLSKHLDLPLMEIKFIS